MHLRSIVFNRCVYDSAREVFAESGVHVGARKRRHSLDVVASDIGEVR